MLREGLELEDRGRAAGGDQRAYPGGERVARRVPSYPVT